MKENAPLRAASIDIFRGLTMLVMIFVNDLAGVSGLPRWTYHMHANEDAMSYVDMVFPAFLFILGMSLPLAIRQRFAKGSPASSVWKHVVIRSLSLIVLGLALANAGKGDPSLMHMPRHVWAVIVLIGAILFWNIYPKTAERRNLYRGLKMAGLLMMAAAFLIFRRTTHGQVAWLDTSYWEILGLIGWTYLAVCILYIPTRQWRWAPMFWLAALFTLNAIAAAGWIKPVENLPFYLWPFNNGSFSAITMAGVVTSLLFFTDRYADSTQKKIALGTGYGLVLLMAGWLLSPLGISKIRATPTWGLYSAGSSVLIFVLLFWICDVKKQTSWAAFVKPAGANTLLTYLLPDLVIYAGLMAWVPSALDHGAAGVARSIVFTLLILAIAGLLTRWKVRMQL